VCILPKVNVYMYAIMRLDWLLLAGSSRELAHIRHRVPVGSRQQRCSRLHVHSADCDDRRLGAARFGDNSTEGCRRGCRVRERVRG